MAILDDLAGTGTGVIIDCFRKLVRSERGATAVEYGLIVSLIVIAAIAAMSNLADTTIDMWNGVAENVVAN